MDMHKQPYTCIFATRDGHCLRSEAEARQSVKAAWTVAVSVVVCAAVTVVLLGVVYGHLVATTTCR